MNSIMILQNNVLKNLVQIKIMPISNWCYNICGSFKVLRHYLDFSSILNLPFISECSAVW